MISYYLSIFGKKIIISADSFSKLKAKILGLNHMSFSLCLLNSNLTYFSGFYKEDPPQYVSLVVTLTFVVSTEYLL